MGRTTEAAVLETMLQALGRAVPVADKPMKRNCALSAVLR